MRRPSPRLFPNLVTFSRRTWSNDRGQRTATPGPVDLACNVQPVAADRVVKWGLELGTAAAVVLFAEDPGLAQGDTFAWSGRTWEVLGPAGDDVGRGVMFALAAKGLT